MKRWHKRFFNLFHKTGWRQRQIDWKNMTCAEVQRRYTILLNPAWYEAPIPVEAPIAPPPMPVCAWVEDEDL